MTVTVLQRKASTQQGLLLVPAIKGAVYTLIYITSSQPELTKIMKILVGSLHVYSLLHKQAVPVLLA